MNLLNLIKTAPDGVIVLDDQDKVVYWNEGATKTFGFTHTEMMGQHLDAIIPEKLRKRHTDAYLKFIKTGISKYEEGHTMAVPAVKKSGEQISIEFRISAEKDDQDNILYVAAIIRDVTQQWKEKLELRKKLQELERKEENATPKKED